MLNIEAGCVFAQSTWGEGADVTLFIYDKHPMAHSNAKLVACVDLHAAEALELGRLVTKCGKLSQDIANDYFLRSLLLP